MSGLVYTQNMATKDYPDILGYITNGARASLSGVQAALAVSPRAALPGRPFHALLLAQNTTDRSLELRAVLSLPAKDARKQKGRFAAAKEQVDFRLKPGEAGYLMLPIMCHRETAPGDGYKLGLAVNVRPGSKGQTIRAENGGSPLQPDTLNDKRRTALEQLRALEFSASKRFGLRDELEVSFSVAPPAKGAENTAPQGGWFSLWNLAEDGSAQLLLERYAAVLQDHVFPKIKKQQMFEALRQATEARFQAAGYPLKPLEAVYIAKLLALVVHMADPGEDQFDYLGSQAFNVAVLLKRDLPESIGLPHWFEGLVRGIAHQEQVAAHPAAYITGKLYDALLLDTIPFAFNMVRTITGEDMGTEEEMRQYAHNFVRSLNTTGRMDFAHTYLPLVMGGAIVFDRVIEPGEKLDETLRGMSDVLAMRDPEWTEDNDLVFLLTRDLVNRSLRLFGFQI